VGIHSVTWIGANGQVAIAPLYVIPALQTPTPTRTNTPAPTATATPTPGVCVPGDTNFVATPSTANSIVPGTTNTGNACDDCATNITLPFTWMFYNQAMTTANVISNGNLQFNSTDAAFTNACLPAGAHNDGIYPLWDDLRTDAGAGLRGYPGGCAASSPRRPASRPAACSTSNGARCTSEPARR
jgi:hypothetical protein